MWVESLTKEMEMARRFLAPDTVARLEAIVWEHPDPAVQEGEPERLLPPVQAGSLHGFYLAALCRQVSEQRFSAAPPRR